MPISFNCPTCGKKITVPDQYAGKKGKCPGCQSAVAVPKAGDVPMGKTPTSVKSPTSPTSSGAPGSKKPTVTTAKGTVKPKPAAVDPLEEPPADDEGGAAQADEQAPVPADEGPSAAAIRAKLRKGTPASAATDTSEDRPGRLSRSRGEMATPKKSGGFMWVVFGLLLAILHTAAAFIVGAYFLTLYAAEPAKYSWFDTPADLLGLKEKIAHLRPAAPSAGTPTPNHHSSEVKTEPSN